MVEKHTWTRPLARGLLGRLPRVGLTAVVVVLGLSACGSTSAATTPTPAPKPGTFTVDVAFTGASTVQGSFTTPTVGATCAQYATSALVWTIGLGPEVGTPITVDGQLINFEVAVPQSVFHGAGNYSGNTVSVLTVGLDTFAGTESTMKLNSDGSGNATFTNYIGTTSSVPESGTITWTCAEN